MKVKVNVTTYETRVYDLPNTLTLQECEDAVRSGEHTPTSSKLVGIVLDVVDILSK